MTTFLLVFEAVFVVIGFVGAAGFYHAGGSVEAERRRLEEEVASWRAQYALLVDMARRKNAGPHAWTRPGSVPVSEWKPKCTHPNAVPVESVVTGDVLARLCPDCNEQLDGPWLQQVDMTKRPATP